jgi:thiol-disulfide isomerase/thioredoxin
VHAIRTTHGADEKYQTLALLAWFGDEKTLAQLKENSTSKDDTTAVEAVCAMGLGDWWKSAHDEAGQTKVLATMKALAHAHEKDDVITRSLMMMANTTPASPALRESAMALIADDLKGPLAARVATMVAAERKLKAMEGKPLVIAGLSLDGKNFTTADWKGKVILVDFWASWCGPCKAELPRVEKAYADFHGKGLEVLGVSCDQGVGPLNIYLQQNPEMKWPQLFDPAKPGWHELAKGFGINGIPTMFLIDKAGILRSVTARQDFETEIPKMLEEKVAEKSNG